jgi:hypothetical protein
MFVKRVGYICMVVKRGFGSGFGQSTIIVIADKDVGVEVDSCIYTKENNSALKISSF